MPQLIETEKLFTNFYTFEGVVKALNGVGVVVNHGETYGLVGESGCGKSVTVRSMMQIVQEPGHIESGKILLFLNRANRSRGVDLLQRSEAYMRSIRGNDISMIFQEAGTALNPVLSIGEQIGESFLFHRRPQMLERTIGEIDRELEGEPGSGAGAIGRFSPKRLWRSFQRRLFSRELATAKAYRARVDEIDNELFRLEGMEDGESLRRKNALNNEREQVRRFDPLAQAVKRIPFLKRYYKSINKVIHKEVVSLLEQLGVPNPDNVAIRFPHELSGGMQQRIVIAIALACHPTLLIADEPTSNLDVTIQAQIIELIRTLKEQSISSVLFITHDLGLVAEICDRVTVMYAGDTAETATVEEIFAEPLHPYTRALLNSVPKVEQTEELSTIPGTVPNLVNPPSGCRFHPRCPHAMEICRREKPPVTEYKPGHTVSCHLYPRDSYRVIEEPADGQ